MAGRYVLLDRIGAGGTATVYCAEDLLLGRRVALKLLRRSFADNEELVERFRREASTAASVCHPHVVAIYDRGEWAGTHYIAMEYVAGRSLKSIIREEAPLEADRALDLAVQFLRAARFVHRRGIIHRDLKPDNAIVDGNGKLKVTDFGIARNGESHLTQPGSIVGTAHYASPEQIQGQPVTAASDLYSVGIILYELLTGRLPFDGDNVVTVALKQVTERPAPPSTINAALPPALERIVMQALAKDPADRFGDAGTFIDELEQARSRLAGSQLLETEGRRRVRRSSPPFASIRRVATRVAGAADLARTPDPWREQPCH